MAVEGWPGEPTLDSLTGVVVHSDMAGDRQLQDARTRCSNQLQHNIVWGQKGNFLDVPTDCPQRDERLGWTGDAQVFARTAAFNMDVAGFFTQVAGRRRRRPERERQRALRGARRAELGEPSSPAARRPGPTRP